MPINGTNSSKTSIGNSVDPHRLEEYLLRGKAHCSAGDFSAGLTAFEQAIAFNSKSCAAHNGRGNALCQLQRHAEALAAYERATALNPTYHEAWFNQGQLLTQMGAYGNALAAYDQAIRYQPSPAELQVYLHAREDIWLRKKLIAA